MTMDAAILLTERTLTVKVVINGVIIQMEDPTSDTGIPGIGGINFTKSLDSPVPVCSIEVNRIPTWIKRGQLVEVNLGYNGLYRRIFTGYVQDRSRGLGRGTIHCLGKLWTAFRTVEIPERSVDGLTVKAALEDIMDDVGITERNITVDAWTLGSASDAKLERMPASQMLQMLMDLVNARIYELASGTIRISTLEELPAPTAYKTYTTTANATARIVEGSDHEDPDYIRTRMIVTGATIVEGAAPDETSRTVTATATLIDSPLVQPPLPSGTYIDAEYSNSLIDTDAKAAELAGIYLTRFARIPRVLTVEITGDPQIELCKTIELDFPEIGAEGNFFVSGVEHIVDASGYVTRMTLRGGDELGGTVGINPVAQFTYKVDREVIGTAVFTFATFDASTSFDPDGTIDTYAWSDDQSTTPQIATKTTAIATVRADTSGWTGDWNVTLTVTDNDGLTGTLTLAIPYEAGASEIVIPAIFAAVNNNASATADGGQVWKKQAGSTCVSVGTKWPDGVHSGYACYGYTDGSIKRTIDFCASALTTELAAAGANGIINDINWDINAASRVWAVTSTGRVLRSDDDGDSWTVYKDFGNTYALNRVSTPSAGGLWVFGGRGDVATSLIQYDALLDGNWHSVSIAGELATDLIGASSAITIAEATSTKYGELAIIFKGAALASDVAIFYTANVHGDGSGWTRATGLDASLVEGRYIVGDGFLPSYLYAAFNNRDTWATTDGVAWTKTANVLPANCVPWHAYYIGWMMPPGLNVHLISVENTSDTTSGIYKTADGFLTAQVLWPATGFTAWPASAKGKMAKVGAQQVAATGEGYVLLAGTLTAPKRMAAWRNGIGNWTTYTFADELTGSDSLIPRALTSTLWFILGFNDENDFNHADNHIVRTQDGGANWASFTQPKSGNDYWQDFALDAGGRLWGLTLDITTGDLRGIVKAWYSVDEGDTWTLSETLTGASPNYHRVFRIVCHPSNQNVIAILGTSGNVSLKPLTWYTTDRGDNWTLNIQAVSLFAALNYPYGSDIIMTASNPPRIVWGGIYLSSGSGHGIASTDDWGLTWTVRKNFGAAATHWSWGVVGDKLGSTLFALHLDNTGSPDHIMEAWYSTDSGNTWTQFDNDVTEYATTHFGIGGLAYDGVTDALYIANEAGLTVNTWLVDKMQPVAKAGTWIDFSDTLVPIGAETHYHISDYVRHIAVIPR